jgi:hypothetical protein
MRWARPDEVIDYFPEGPCPCGADLAGAADLGVARSYQQQDVPEPRPAVRYQHDLHKARCACGKVHVAARPAGVPDAPLSVGPRLSAMAVYLSVFQHVPVERAQFLIADLTGCAAHLIRDFADCDGTYPGAAWPEQAIRSLRGFIHAWHAAREQGLPAIPAAGREPPELEFRRAVTVGLAAVSRVPGPKNKVKQKPGREMLEFCRDRQDYVLRFTKDTSVWPTNNISERGVRPLKTQQKISGRLTSDDVTQDRLDIRGYIDTARKHGLGACEILHQLMPGNPWLPPAQPVSP